MPDPASPDVEPTATPGSPGWSGLLNDFRTLDPSPRRAELHRLADQLRAVLHRLVQTSAPLEMITQAADDLHAIAERFSAHPNASIYEGFAEAANAGEPYAFFDHSPVIGRANPLAPPIELTVEERRVVGSVTFGAAYEGPPGCVHGGYVAAAFDEVLGSTQSLSGTPGMTGRLTIHYRSPTPLHTELRFIGELVGVDGRKITTTGQVFAGDRLCAEAEGLFISVDKERFSALMLAREERQPT